MTTGILGIWLSIKEQVWAWPCFVSCYACYVYISYTFELPALMLMNATFIGLSFYGWAKWINQSSSKQQLRISRASSWQLLLTTVFIAIGTLIFGGLIAKYGGANYPYLDAFATSCGFTAQWMLGRKQIETWIFWMISDLVYLIIFALGSLWPTVILFSTFTALAINGWRQWRTLLH